MARFTTTLTSVNSPEVVFDALADFSNTAQWDPNVEKGERLDDGPVGVGSTFKLLNDFFGQKQRLIYEMLEFDRPGRFVVKAETSAFDSLDTITVVTEGEGSSVTYDAVVTLKSRLAPVMDPVVGLLFRIVGGKAAKGLREFVNRSDLSDSVSD